MRKNIILLVVLLNIVLGIFTLNVLAQNPPFIDSANNSVNLLTKIDNEPQLVSSGSLTVYLPIIMSPPPILEGILFTSNRNGTEDIFVMDVDGANVTPLIATSGADRQPALAPNGRQLLFSTNKDGNWEIYFANSDGTKLTNITNHSANDLHPIWSPDGTQFTFESDRSGN